MPYNSGHDGHDFRQVIFDGNDAASKLSEESGHRRVDKNSDAELSRNDVPFFPRVKSLNFYIKNLSVPCNLEYRSGLRVEENLAWKSSRKQLPLLGGDQGYAAALRDQLTRVGRAK